MEFSKYNKHIHGKFSLNTANSLLFIFVAAVLGLVDFSGWFLHYDIDKSKFIEALNLLNQFTPFMKSICIRYTFSERCIHSIVSNIFFQMTFWISTILIFFFKIQQQNMYQITDRLKIDDMVFVIYMVTINRKFCT